MQSTKRAQIYLERKSKCVCVRCGKNPTDGKHVRCDNCLKKEKEYYAKNKEILLQKGRANREKWKQLNICIRCGKNDVMPGSSQCQECAKRSNSRKHTYTKEAYEKHLQTMNARYVERKRQCICVRCGREKAMPGKVRCLACNQYVNQSRSGYVEHTAKWYEKERKAGRI